MSKKTVNVSTRKATATRNSIRSTPSAAANGIVASRTARAMSAAIITGRRRRRSTHAPATGQRADAATGRRRQHAEGHRRCAETQGSQERQRHRRELRSNGRRALARPKTVQSRRLASTEGAIDPLSKRDRVGYSRRCEFEWPAIGGQRGAWGLSAPAIP